MNWVRRSAINGALAVCSFFVALALTELIVRIVAPQPTGLSHQDKFGLALHYPGITRYLPQYGHTVSFNSAGMRDREHAIAKPAGTYRVLLLGDSFMEAFQVPFQASMPSLLEKSLAQALGKTVEVINAGVSGWGTDDELRYLTAYGLQYQPDLVVIAMTLHNDISDNLRQDWHRLNSDTLIEVPHTATPFLAYKLVELKAYVATRLQAYQLWRRVRHGREIKQVGQRLNSHVAQLFEEPRPDAIRDGEALTRLLLQRIESVSAAAGAQTLLVLLPIRYQLSDSLFSSFVKSSGIPPGLMHMDEPQAALRGIADSLHLPVIDLLPGFQRWASDSSASLYLEWDGHWTETGHRLANELVTAGIVQYLDTADSGTGTHSSDQKAQ